MSSSSSVPEAKMDGGIASSDSPSRSTETVREAVALWAFLAVLAYVIVRSLAYAMVKPFWVDEVLTETVSSLPNVSSIMKSLNLGLDSQPLLFYLIERNAASWFLGHDLSYRIPSILGFVCTMVFLYVFVKTRNGAAPALLSASVLLATQLFTLYAAEARPYSLLTACVALAMVCYQRVDTPLGVAGLFLSLLLACCLHFYGVAELMPFVLGELTTVQMTKKVRLGVWFALIVAPLPWVFSLPILLRMKQRWGTHYWNRYYIGPGYSSFFSGTGLYFGTVVAGIAIVVMLASFFSKTLQGRTAGSTASSIAERVLILTLILVPMVGFTAAKITHFAFANRYFLPGILGIAAAAGYLFARAKSLTLVLAAIVFVFVIGRQEEVFWTAQRQDPVQQFLKLIEAAHHDDLPIVVADLDAYVLFWHGVTPAVRSRIVALPDPDKAVLYSGADSSDKLVLVLRSYLPLKSMDFSVFAAEYPVFLLYSDKSVRDWWPACLRDKGYSLRLLAVRDTDSIYLVESKGAP